MVGLDVTLQALASANVRARIAGLGRLADDLLLPCLSGYVDGADTEPDTGTPADAEVAFDPAALDWRPSIRRASTRLAMPRRTATPRSTTSARWCT
jgi:inosine-uridine nucleoside N-ribohydrolase